MPHANQLAVCHRGTMANLRKAKAADGLRAITTVLLPPVVKGPVVRRPAAVGLLDRLGADDRAVEEMQRLRDLYGPDPVVLSLLGRRFALTWQRVVRRVVLGDSARDDDRITDDLLALRRLANFSYLAPRRPALRERFLGRLDHYIRAAEPGSLAGIVAETPAPEGTAKREQIPQWLFAFDAGTWASFRALALLASHPEAAETARSEVDSFPNLPSYRSTMLEALRLWPTTPLILRDTTEDTEWRTGNLAAGASVVVFAPFFHRDDTRLENAHSFDPGQWLRARTDRDWPLVPFSGGAGMCPGRNVVLLVASVVLARLASGRSWEVNRGMDPGRLPGLLDPFSLRFR